MKLRRWLPPARRDPAGTQTFALPAAPAPVVGVGVADILKSLQTAGINGVNDHRGAVRGVGQAAKARFRQRHALGKQDYRLPAGHVAKAIDHVTQSAQRACHEHATAKLIDRLVNRVESG